MLVSKIVLVRLTRFVVSDSLERQWFTEDDGLVLLILKVLIMGHHLYLLKVYLTGGIRREEYWF